jgi:site-specific DNA-methyltransferase (adenine-specific)
MFELNKIYCMDAIEGMKQIPDNFIDLTVTSPPYFNLRVYSNDKKEIGIEEKEEEYIINLLKIFNELRRITKLEGGFYLNIGDTYNRDTGQLRMIPFKLSESLKQNGWILRSIIIWHKRNCLPQSSKNKFSNVFEPIFHFQKQKDDYYFDLDSIRIPHKISKDKMMKEMRKNIRLKDKTKEDLITDKSKYKKFIETNIKMDLPLKKQQYHEKGKNPGNVWRIKLEASELSHVARYPEELCIIPIKAGCPQNGIVFDMFMGSGSTAVVAKKLGRKYLGFDINPDFVRIANERLDNTKEGDLLKKESSNLDKWFRR